MLYQLFADAGKDALKCLVGDKEFYLKNRVYEGNDAPEGCHLVTFQGVTYVVGDSTNGSPSFDMSKAIIENKVLIFLAMALMLPNNSHVHLITGMPVQLWTDRANRQSYIDFFSCPDSNGEVTITVDGIESTYIIENVTVLAESSGYVYRRAEQFEDEVVAIIDIGGLNTNGAVYSQLNVVKSSTFSINKGASILRTEVKDALRTKLNINPQDYIIEHLIKNPTPEMEPVIKEVMYNFLRVILQEIKAHNWDLSLMEVRFIGGGTIPLRRYINRVFEGVNISSDGVWDNVKGWKILIEEVA